MTLQQRENLLYRCYTNGIAARPYKGWYTGRGARTQTNAIVVPPQALKRALGFAGGCNVDGMALGYVLY